MSGAVPTKMRVQGSPSRQRCVYSSEPEDGSGVLGSRRFGSGVLGSRRVGLGTRGGCLGCRFGVRLGCRLGVRRGVRRRGFVGGDSERGLFMGQNRVLSVRFFKVKAYRTSLQLLTALSNSRRSVFALCGRLRGLPAVGSGGRRFLVFRDTPKGLRMGTRALDRYRFGLEALATAGLVGLRGPDEHAVFPRHDALRVVGGGSAHDTDRV